MSKTRIQRETETISEMIRVYCRGVHRTQHLCGECSELEQYASLRLQKCPFQENKTTCGKCKVHCYKADMRKKIRDVMRYSGPRMLFLHPLQLIRHYFDEFRKS